MVSISSRGKGKSAFSSRNDLKRSVSFFLLTFVMIPFVVAQSVTRGKVINSGSKGNQIFPAWSPSGRYLAYQSNQNGNWDIFIYDLKTKKTIQVTSSLTDEMHPVWVRGKYALVYDSKKNGAWHLYFKNLKTGRERLLFHNNIQAREASFSPTGRLVAFSGFDPSTSHWQIFTYDLVYNNLNVITEIYGDAFFPVFSPNGRFLAYYMQNFTGHNFIQLTNWFGNFNKRLSTGRGRVSWTSDSWRLIFVPNNGSESIVSVGEDGSGFEQIKDSGLPMSCPAVSPDGKKIAYSINTAQGWKIVIANLSL